MTSDGDILVDIRLQYQSSLLLCVPPPTLGYPGPPPAHSPEMSGVRCQVSGFRCQVSGVRCQMSCVRCQVSGDILHSSGVYCQVSFVSFHLPGVVCQVPFSGVIHHLINYPSLKQGWMAWTSLISKYDQRHTEYYYYYIFKQGCWGTVYIVCNVCTGTDCTISTLGSCCEHLSVRSSSSDFPHP